MEDPAPSGWLVWTGRAILILSSLVTAFFFLTRWALDLRVHARDLGLGFFLAFANPVSLYASFGLAILCGLAAVGAAIARRAWRLLGWATLVAALPVAYLAVFG